jgi:membrane protease YdiL (CAAX protease family)
MASTSTPQVLAPLVPGPIQATARQRWVDLGLVLLIGFAPLVLRAIYALVIPIQGTEGSTNYRFIFGLLQEFGVLTLFFCLLKRQGRSLRDIGFGFHWTDIPKGFGLTLLSLAALYLCWSMIAAWSYYVIGHPPQFRDPRIIFSGASTGLFLIYVFAAPIYEETLVRGYLMTELIGLSCPVWLAVLASCILQASYHLYYGFAGAIALSAGFAVSSIYFARSRKLMPVLLSHLFWDLGAFFMNRHTLGIW